MAEKRKEGKHGSRQSHGDITGSETKAERAEEKTFWESVREYRIVSGVRTRIDKYK